ncbi:sigma 54-interacting transcriptional regulator [Alkalihalobacillus sp. LMS6]|uniref:sigma-54 interaction domain-containing protein n=1 Tax=Alkalihalobacillus sp. LMS6 TaxID=2924034 RepID=UPI0020D18C7B|nr:sigma 54-interacting transcriptional regulator [Alkalihalobacillus sp. LMS6]UTR08438.1 sigma 54-interacting transcriptional regulator [Alkalihalobacillus sp. LMS6]
MLTTTERKVDWGYIETNEHSQIVFLSDELCATFQIVKDEWLGVPARELIRDPSSRKPKHVFFGRITGYACLIRVVHLDQHRQYHVLIRQDEVTQVELMPFMNAIESTSKKKNQSRQSKYSFSEVLGESESMEQVKELAARIATSQSTVLLTGESGTGKELFAQAIHGLSTRKHDPFVAVNCAAIPADLFESEVFGYEGGAFSGAKREGKPGKVELAQHGTLFLDEISELPYAAQGKLLRVLQEREIERLGGTSSKNVDIRIIAATNRDLSMLVHEGKFRQDLFYRLYVFDLKIPALRQRKEDILLLAESFVAIFNDRLGLQVESIDMEMQQWMLHYEWPGNVRELKAYIERAMNLTNGHVLKRPVEPMLSQPVEVGTDRPLYSLEDEVRRAEENAIRKALKQAEGDRTTAARLLGIHLASLYRKLSKYQIKD